MNTKFKSIVTGAILEPNSEMVAEQLRKNPSLSMTARKPHRATKSPCRR